MITLSHEDNLSRVAPKQQKTVLLESCQGRNGAYLDSVTNLGRHVGRVLLWVWQERSKYKKNKEQKEVAFLKLTTSSKLLCTTSCPLEETLMSWFPIISRQGVLEDWPKRVMVNI